MRKKLIVFLLVFAMAFSLAACGGSGGGGGGGASQPAGGGGGGGAPAAPAGGGGGPAIGGGAAVEPPTEDVEVKKGGAITVAFNAIPNGLDPISEDLNTTISICSHIFDSLVYMDVNWVWNPNVATAWRQVDDVTWEFDINLDYVFHNGDKLTMDDVVFSVLRLKDIPKSADTARNVADATYSGNVLTIKLAAPNNTTIPGILWTLIIVNKKNIEANGDKAVYTEPVGTGPFKLTSFIPGASVTIERFENDPFDRAILDKIDFVAIPENSNRYISVESGQVQYAGLVSAFEMQMAREADRFNLIEALSNRTTMIMINVEKPPLDSVNVRRALCHAFDRESFCLLNGGRHPIQSIFFGGFEMYYESPNWPQYDMAKAKELLEAEGISPANPVEIDLMFYAPDPGIELWQSSLRELGVILNLELLEFSVYLSRQPANNYMMCFSAIRNVAGYPLMDLDRVDSRFTASRNLARYNNPEVDALIDIARTTQDQAELTRVNHEIEDIIAQDVPKFGIFLQGNYAVMDKNLLGVFIRGDLLQDFRGAYLAN